MLLTQLRARLIFTFLLASIYIYIFFCMEGFSTSERRKKRENNFTDHRYETFEKRSNSVAGESEPSVQTRTMSFLDYCTVHLYTGTIACHETSCVRITISLHIYPVPHPRLSSPLIFLRPRYLPLSSSFFCPVSFLFAFFHALFFSSHHILFSQASSLCFDL